MANSTAIQNYRSPVWYLEQVLAYSTFIPNVGASSEFHHFFTPKKILTTPFGHAEARNGEKIQGTPVGSFFLEGGSWVTEVILKLLAPFFWWNPGKTSLFYLDESLKWNQINSKANFGQRWTDQDLPSILCILYYLFFPSSYIKHWISQLQQLNLSSNTQKYVPSTWQNNSQFAWPWGEPNL